VPPAAQEQFERRETGPQARQRAPSVPFCSASSHGPSTEQQQRGEATAKLPVDCNHLSAPSALGINRRAPPVDPAMPHIHTYFLACDRPISIAYASNQLELGPARLRASESRASFSSTFFLAPSNMLVRMVLRLCLRTFRRLFSLVALDLGYVRNSLRTVFGVDYVGRF